MNQMQIFNQLMQAPNKQQMLQSLIAQNPQANQMWQVAQQLAQNPNKQQVIQQIAQKRGMTVDEVITQARNFGVNI